MTNSVEATGLAPDHFVPEQLYCSQNLAVCSIIPSTAASLLDVGCGTGALLRWVRGNMGPTIHLEGITYSSAEAVLASPYANKLWTGDLNRFDFDRLGQFDCIVCSHVLEHLNWPEQTLISLKKHLAADGSLIIALPNALHYKPRFKFLRGRFRYTDQGPMDRTHFRFFDFSSAQELLKDVGYEIEYLNTPGSCPLPLIRRYLGPLAQGIDRFVAAKWPGLFAVQFVLQCRNRPSTGSQPPLAGTVVQDPVGS